MRPELTIEYTCHYVVSKRQIDDVDEKKSESGNPLMISIEYA